MTAIRGLCGDGLRVALGAMRLSTDPNREDGASAQVLHAAFDAGVTLVDTADAYCHDATDTGLNERLIAQAIATWAGDRSRIRVATKGGLTRPNGLWIPDGRAKHLIAACEASRRALAVDRIHLYQLHAVDPRTPLATSMRALSALKRDGLVASIGLCNVTVGQIEAAREIDDVDAVQVELNPWKDENILNGVVAFCNANRIQLLAHRPLGGPQRRRRIERDPVLREIADARDGSPFEIVLAWLLQICPSIVPVAGATKCETARSIARSAHISLTDDERRRLDEHFPAGRALRLREAPAVGSRALRLDGEVVLVMGLPGAGKSTVAEQFVARGYARLNRDASGGSLSDLLPELDRLIDTGATRIVLDNTYISREARARVIGAAAARALSVRCIALDTSLEDAQINAVHRMLARHGRLLTPEEIRTTSRRDVTSFGPSVQFRYQRELEPPDPSEGFTAIETIAFERRRNPSFTNKAVILWCDGVLRRSRDGARTPQSVEDVEILPNRREVLHRHVSDGWRLLALSWQPEIAEATMSAGAVDAIIARTIELVGVPLEIAYCPHPAGPPICWCRKPLPGLAVAFIEKYQLDPMRCVYVGAGAQDPGFARRLGLRYCSADEFFPES